MRQVLQCSTLALFALLGAQTSGAQTLQIDNFSTSLSAIQGQSSLSISPGTGNVTVISSANPGYNSCTSPSGGTPALTFNSPPSSGTINQSINISWTATLTTGANPCTPTGGGSTNWVNQGVAPASSTRSVTLPSTAGSVNFGMTCTTASGNISNSFTVVVNDVQQGCDGANSEGLPIATFPTTWSDVFGTGTVFPNPLGNGKNLSVGVGTVVSIGFNSSTAIPQVTIEAIEAPAQPAAPVRMSVSKCRADFRDSLLIDNLCMDRGANNSPSLVLLTGFPTSPSYCALTPSTLYFLNLTHRVPAFPSPPVSSSDCPVSTCVIRLVSRSLTRAEAEALGVEYIEARP